MHRSFVFAAATAAALLASRADAIEMFTNFNNGTNVGFPPMEVPVRVYRGIGRGGWNPRAEGMYFRSNPPVPAMMPTGQLPKPVVHGNDFGSIEQTASSVQYTADRRRSGRRQYTPNTSSNSSSDMNSTGSAIPTETMQGGNSPTPAKAPEADDAASSVAPVQKKQSRSVTVLRPQSGNSVLKSNSDSTINSRSEGSLPQSPSALFPQSAN